MTDHKINIAIGLLAVLVIITFLDFIGSRIQFMQSDASMRRTILNLDKDLGNMDKEEKEKAARKVLPNPYNDSEKPPR